MDRHISAPVGRETAEELRAGDYVYITGTIYTARDAAHKRMYETLREGGDLPINIEGQAIYTMGPSPAREGRPIGSAGPTTASRMDKYTPELLDLGMGAMIGKGKRSQEVIDAVVRNKAVYFAAVGGAGALLSKCITSSEIVAYEDLGTEAIRKLTVVNLPVIVVIDSKGNNLYETAIKGVSENMKRILMMVLRNIILVPFMWCKLCYHAHHVDKYTEEEHYKMLKFIVRRANKGGNVTIAAEGLDNIPKENGFMFFPNHQGMYDVLAIMDVCPVPISVVAKKEVANIQFLKQVFACTKAYMIDREDVRQAMQVIMNVAKEVKAGRNYIIFPEGTRSRNGNKIGTFKGGSFKAATKARCPIVPVALIDSFKPFDTKSISKVTVQVCFLPPLYYDEYKDMKTTEIAAIVQERIRKTIEEKTELAVY